MNLDELRVYQKGMEVGEEVWLGVLGWDPFARSTVGRQFVRSADSIAANIAEGYGRRSFADNRRFCFYARGSLMETETWLRKAIDRNLIPAETGERLRDSLCSLHRSLNAYIRSIGPVEDNPKDRDERA